MIHKLDIAHFGAFHNTQVTFSEGYQCLAGPNESGKTTTIMCIHALLYGFSKDSLNRRLYSDDYERYLPLEGGAFSAAMELETGEGRYRMERNFRKENETTTVIDLDKNQVIEDEAFFRFSGIAQPGAYFWGLSQDDFLKFFCMSDLQNISPQGIFERIEASKNFLIQGHSDLRFTDAYAYLDRERKKVGTDRAKKSPIGENKQQLEKEAQRLAELKEKKREAERVFQSKDRAADTLRGLKRREARQRQKASLPRLHSEIQEVGRIDEALDQNEQKIQAFESKTHSRFPSSSMPQKLTGALCLLFTALTVFLVLAFQSEIAGLTFLGAVASFISSIAFTLLRRRNRGQIERYHRWYTERDGLLEEKHRLYQWIDPMVEADFDLEHLQEVMVELARNLEALPEEPHVEEEIEAVQRKLGFMSGKEREVIGLNEEIDQAKKRYQKEEARREALLRERETIDLTEQLLKEVDAAGRKGFKQDILADAEACLDALSDGRYDTIILDERGLAITGVGRGLLRDEQLSQSTADILVMSLRLAAVQRMDPSIPMIFDDGFVFMDSARRRRVTDVLKAMNRQVLEFTTP